MTLNNFDQAKNFFLLGLESYQKELYEQAEIFLFASLNILPDRLSTLTNLSAVLIKLEKLDKASEIINNAIDLYPNDEVLHLNRGQIFEKSKKFQMALENYDKAIELNYNYAEAYYNRGIVLNELTRLKEAMDSFNKAVELDCDYADAYYNRGIVLHKIKNLEGALASYIKVIELKPDYAYLQGIHMHIKMFMCIWKDYEANVKNLALNIMAGKKSSPSFAILALTDSLSIQHKTSEIWIKDKYPLNSSLGSIVNYKRKNKIRIGYYSADFHNHATAYLMAELFELHDKNNFEFIAFSFGQDNKDEMRQRLSTVFDQFLDVKNKSDKDIALMSREMGIDIAVDLKGFTQDNRVGIFSYRAAPIQVNYIGYPGTMAADYIDYIIADSTLIPIESQRYYSEKIVYLPFSYQVNDRQRKISQKLFTKEELGLPKVGFVFCCFNNNFKITPRTYDGWMRVLKAVEGSVLWLLEDNLTAGINLRKEAVDRGVDPSRLIFAKRMELSMHLARHRLADLFIDTFPCNAHTTASDALWAGLPVLTCMGESFASRVAASLLNAIELPELITTTQNDFEEKAIEIAMNPEKLKYIKEKLEFNKQTTALFDTPRFTKHIEAAYTRMYERYQGDLITEHIYIEPCT